ncbi:MAG: hypothetical protein M3040_13570, partial [Bacteroidota bacterium]|nr:hypothetical protein [Bacteroidota bacterium]
MLKLIKILLFALLMIFNMQLVSTAQRASQIKASQQIQYSVPFSNVPDKRDVTLYQVNIRTFSKDGNFAGVLARLDSIKALGVNVVYL